MGDRIILSPLREWKDADVPVVKVADASHEIIVQKLNASLGDYDLWRKIRNKASDYFNIQLIHGVDVVYVLDAV